MTIFCHTKGGGEERRKHDKGERKIIEALPRNRQFTVEMFLREHEKLRQAVELQDKRAAEEAEELEMVMPGKLRGTKGRLSASTSTRAGSIARNSKKASRAIRVRDARCTSHNNMLLLLLLLLLIVVVVVVVNCCLLFAVVVVVLPLSPPLSLSLSLLTPACFIVFAHCFLAYRANQPTKR